MPEKYLALDFKRNCRKQFHYMKSIDLFFVIGLFLNLIPNDN